MLLEHRIVQIRGHAARTTEKFDVVPQMLHVPLVEAGHETANRCRDLMKTVAVVAQRHEVHRGLQGRIGGTDHGSSLACNTS